MSTKEELEAQLLTLERRNARLQKENEQLRVDLAEVQLTSHRMPTQMPITVVEAITWLGFAFSTWSPSLVRQLLRRSGYLDDDVRRRAWHNLKTPGERGQFAARIFFEERRR
jgi:hypothetical protein